MILRSLRRCLSTCGNPLSLSLQAYARQFASLSITDCFVALLLAMTTILSAICPLTPESRHQLRTIFIKRRYVVRFMNILIKRDGVWLRTARFFRVSP